MKKDFLKRTLDTMIIEIDITKCEKTFRQIMNLFQKLEKEQLKNKNLEIKDIYFK